MKVLIVKLTSLGDVIHALPAITDAKKAIPSLEIDFLVDEQFEEIPTWHNAVNNVQTVANRRWRREGLKSIGQIWRKRSALREVEYDKVIDLQGLMKSALWAKAIRGQQHGYDATSIKEPFAAKLYKKTHKVEKRFHAIQRNRELLAAALGYKFESEELDYSISFDIEKKGINLPEKPFWVFLHGTAWASKQWPEDKWRELAGLLEKNGKQIVIPWGSEAEKARAERIAAHVKCAIVLPKLSLSELIKCFEPAEALISVDTGLGHLAAALNKPTVAIYGPTDTKLVGISGKHVKHICAQQDALIGNVEKVPEAIKTNKLFDYSSVTSEKVFSLAETAIEAAYSEIN